MWNDTGGCASCIADRIDGIIRPLGRAFVSFSRLEGVGICSVGRQLLAGPPCGRKFQIGGYIEVVDESQVQTLCEPNSPQRPHLTETANPAATRSKAEESRKFVGLPHLYKQFPFNGSTVDPSASGSGN